MRRVLLAAAALAVAVAAQAWAQSGTSGAPTSPPASPIAGAAAGASTSPLPPQGRSIPAMATLPRPQYVIDAGAVIREWHPIVDTYLDSEVRPGNLKNQTQVKAAWDKLRLEWDNLLKADDATWNAHRSSFEAAWSQFETTWQMAKSQS